MDETIPCIGLFEGFQIGKQTVDGGKHGVSSFVLREMENATVVDRVHSHSRWNVGEDDSIIQVVAEVASVLLLGHEAGKTAAP